MALSKELQAEMIIHPRLKFAVFSSLASILVSLAGCSQSESHGGASPAPTAIKVRVAKPVVREVTDFMDYTGRTEPRESVEIRPRVSGYLTKVEFMGSLDSDIEKETLLFEIDDRPYVNALDAAKARLASAEAALKTSSAELERTQGLFDKGVVVKSELDRDIGRKAQADADILSARAGLKQAELDLEFTKIKSPISGLISKPNLTVGNLVTPATASLTTIVSADPIYVYFDLDEPTMLTIQQNIRDGKLATREEQQYQVLLGLANDKDYPYTGDLDFIDNRVDPGTGTIRVRGVFKNPKPERGSRPLSAGLFARVRVPLGKPHQAVLISERAVSRDQGKTFAFVVDAENTVTARPIRLGPVHDGLRVVLDGLKPEDQIIIDGLQRVRPGVKVDPVLKEMQVSEKK